MDIKKLALTVAVGVLLSLFFGFLVDAIYEAPEYNDFCDENERFPVALEKPLGVEDTDCPKVTVSQELRDSCTKDKGYVGYDLDENNCRISPYCETCDTEFRSANEKYSKNLFYILIPISILLIIIGMYLVSLESIGSGFILGGLLLIIYATMRVFGDLSKIMRVILLGVELVLVIWLGYKKIEKSGKKR